VFFILSRPAMFLVLIVAAISACSVVQVVRGVPAVTVAVTFPASTTLGQAPLLPLSSSGASIVAVEGLGTLASAGQTTPRPIASVTKVMTAYVILKGHPLALGQPGPTLTLTARDEARYLQMILEDQSAVPVFAGLQLTQLQLLQGLLIPSANNFAEILATWDAGSVAGFVAKMNNEARALGMLNTTYADASGLSPASVSTTTDQLVLIQKAMEDPLFRQVVAMPQMTLPRIGLLTNVNTLLGQDGIIGVKTGYTEDAGGNLAFAAQRLIGNRAVEIFGLVLGQTTRPLAFDATTRIVRAVGESLQARRVIAAYQPVASIDTEWGDAIDVVVAEDVEMLFWPGMTLEAIAQLDPVEAPLAAGAQVGWLNIRLGEQQRRVPLVLAAALPGAPLLWRLTQT
jgi:D-alanyl-D-alanine carboxypeptidase (penicillin-binding protein 5/6)